MERILLAARCRNRGVLFMRWFWRRMPLVHAVLFASACGVTDTDEPSPVESVVVTPPTLEVGAGATGALDAEVTGIGRYRPARPTRRMGQRESRRSRRYRTTAS